MTNKENIIEGMNEAIETVRTAGEVKLKHNLEFVPFPKIKRLFKDNMVISEKIDGTNASVTITEDGQILAGSRTR